MLEEQELTPELFLASKKPIPATARFRYPDSEWPALFWIGGIDDMGQIKSIQSALAETADGGTPQDFAQLVSDFPWGQSGRLMPDQHINMVYRTNVMHAYSVCAIANGLCDELEEFLPGLEIIVIRDERTSNICMKLGGLYVPRKLVLTGRFTPPFHTNCRTGVSWVGKEEWEHRPSLIIKPDFWTTVPKNAKPQRGYGYFPSSIVN